MTIIETSTSFDGWTFRQRWSNYLTLIFCIAGAFIGLNLRNSTLQSTSLYTNPQAGITAAYPANWLLDEDSNRYIFRVRDMTTADFNTTLQVATRPISSLTTSRMIFDSLSLERAQIAGYSVISEMPYTLPDGTETRAMTYTFVSTEVNPFLQGTATVAQGIDILLIEREQAVIITFQADSDSFQSKLPILERFLRSLRF